MGAGNGAVEQHGMLLDAARMLMRELPRYKIKRESGKARADELVRKQQKLQ